MVLICVDCGTTESIDKAEDLDRRFKGNDKLAVYAEIVCGTRNWLETQVSRLSNASHPSFTYERFRQT